MESLEKELQRKVNLIVFLQLTVSDFRLKCVKGLQVNKIVKVIKFDGTRDKIEAKSSFQRLLTKYLGLTLVFLQNSSLREKFNYFF